MRESGAVAHNMGQGQSAEFESSKCENFDSAQIHNQHSFIPDSGCSHFWVGIVGIVILDDKKVPPLFPE